MALTQAQLDQHFRQALVARLAAERDVAPSQLLLSILRGLADYARRGDADSVEAAKTGAQFFYETFTGRAATAADLHVLRNHIAPEVGARTGDF